jgi:translation initiation factor 2 subunit 1
MVEYPKENELVICRITKITNYGVFAELLEYNNIEGFIHISQVSSTWIKNIHNHVKQNQIRASKVLKVDTTKNHVDLSFNRVAAVDEKRKISEYRLFKRAQGILATTAEQLGVDVEELWTKIAEPLLDVENSLYTGFVNLLRYGPEKHPDIDKKILPKVIDILSKNITIKDKVISGVLNVSCLEANGSKIIKDGCIKTLKEYKNSSLVYVGPGRFSLKVSGIDYKHASKDFKKITDDFKKNLSKCVVSIVEDDKK